jgi:hypothetical protein
MPALAFEEEDEEDGTGRKLFAKFRMGTTVLRDRNRERQGTRISEILAVYDEKTAQQRRDNAINNGPE